MAALRQILEKITEKNFLKARFLNRRYRTLKKQYFPCITVSRESGSGGKLVATMVAKKLDMKLYDREFVELIAKSAKKRKEIIKDLDEKSRGIIEGIIDSLLPAKDKLSENTYFHHLCRTILSLIEKEPAVILGRGANFIIPPQKALHVRIIAPLQNRLNNAVKFEKLTLEQAKDRIKKIHFARNNFIKRYFGKNISNANYYDLVINTQHISLDQAVLLIIKAFHNKFYKNKPS